MSVKECSRHGCDHIMCDRYSRRYGYICSECFEELVQCGPDTNIDSFMNSYKGYCNEEAAFTRFNVEFPLPLEEEGYV